MILVYLILAMIVVGLIGGFLTGLIWKDNRPYGVKGDYLIAIVVAVVVGVLDYFVIPAMGFSETIKWLGVAIEPFVDILIVAWLIRYAKR